MCHINLKYHENVSEYSGYRVDKKMFTHRGTDARLIAECLEPVSQGIKIVLNIKNLQYFVVRVLMQNWMTDGLAVTQKRT